MSDVERQLAELGVEIPLPPPPVGSFLNAVASGNLLFLSGAGPVLDGRPAFLGKLGSQLTVEQGREAARLAALNLLAAAEAELGSLDRVTRVVKLLCLVSSSEGFDRQPDVANGASDLLVDVFGERGRHARSAIGVYGLPGGIPVEIEGIFAFE